MDLKDYKGYGCEHCGRKYVYSDSLDRHLAVCPTRLRKIIANLLHLTRGRYNSEGTREAEAVLKESGKGR